MISLISFLCAHVSLIEESQASLVMKANIQYLTFCRIFALILLGISRELLCLHFLLFIAIFFCERSHFPDEVNVLEK